MAGMDSTPRKRKVTYEQSVALERGRNVARRNQRARVAARQAAEQAARDAQRAAAEHVHYWLDWSLNDDDVTETRECSRCGATETRQWRGLGL
jgi:hypothetical protein